MTPRKSSTLCWGGGSPVTSHEKPLMLSTLSVRLPFDQCWGVYPDYPTIDFLVLFEEKNPTPTDS